MIRGVAEIREAYRTDAVAQQYVGERFTQPLGAMLHDRQVNAVVDAIRRERPQRILELAPGPARVTLDVARRSTASGVILDASIQMLGEARKRLREFADRWRPVQGDAFSLPVQSPFDLVYSFRLIRHFDAVDRQRLYRQVFQALRPGGVFIFDAVNETVSAPLRAASPEEYQHYDALLHPEVLMAELRHAGFKVESLKGVQHSYGLLRRLQILVAPRSARLARLLMELVDALGGQPLEWVVVCRRA